MRGNQSSFVLTFALITSALVGCSRLESKQPDTPAKDGAPTTTADENRAPLGSTLCQDTAVHCSTYKLVLPASHVPAGLRDKSGGAGQFLNESLPNVISTTSESAGLVVSVKLPDQSATEVVEIVIPKNSEKTDYALSTDEELIAKAFNESESDSLYAFAQRSPKDSPTGRIKVTLSKITAKDKEAALKGEVPQWPVNLHTPMGQASVRDQQQEVEIAPTTVNISSLSKSEVDEIKRKQRTHGDFPTHATVYFQDGQVKSAPDASDAYGKVDASKDYCFVTATVAAPQAGADTIALAGVITLVTGTSQYGPVDGNGKPTDGFSQSSILGLKNSGAASMTVEGKGYNKFGNGRRDSESLFTLGCTSKNPEPMTVYTIVRALGEERVKVTYPRADIIESYLDEKNGVDLDLGQIQYRWKRLDRAAGSKITVLQNIDSAESGNVSFQNGQPVKDTDSNGGPVCYIPNHLKTGTQFTLVKAWPNTVKVGDAPPVSNGAVFTTDNKAIDRITVYIVPAVFGAPAKITANPALLDAQAIKDCFGSYVSIAD